MRTYNWIHQHIPRPSLYWMSIHDVFMFRNKLLGLFLAPDVPLTISPPQGGNFFTMTKVLIYGKAHPMFVWSFDKNTYEAHLKLSTKLPMFDLKVNDRPIETVSFNDERVSRLIPILKSFSKYMPFLPTDNFIQKEGKFIA